MEFLFINVRWGSAFRRLALTLSSLLRCGSRFAFALLATSLVGETIVKNQDEFFTATEKLKPGDTIVLGDGVWHDFQIVFEGSGTPEEPITLTAQTKGQVIISGKSNLRIAGEHLIVSGLVFKDGYTPTNTVVSFRRSKEKLANHSRITEIVIDNFNNPERHETDFWVMMYGKHNRFDHNYLAGKSNKGVTMAVRLDSPASQENHHRIDHNYFGHRPILGSNGGETLRIGTSHYSMSNSFTVVQSNYFDRCNGEVEIVSSKSGGNRFVGNVFFESQGTLTLRHGNNNLIEDNVFLGNNVAHTGGIRVINKRQQIRNNYLSGLTGHRFGGALVIMNGVPNSPINRYHQVEDSTIENNTIINSRHIELAAGADEERSAPPITTTFRTNLFYNIDRTQSFTVHDDVSGIEFEANVTNVPPLEELRGGFHLREFEMEPSANGLLYPVDEELRRTGADTSLKVLSKNETGPAWYPKPAVGARFYFGSDADNTDAREPTETDELSWNPEPSFFPGFEQGENVLVNPGENTLAQALAKSPDGGKFVLADGTYTESSTLVIEKPYTFEADEGTTPHISFERSSLFELSDGGSLRLKGLTISGHLAPDMAGNALIRTSRHSMLSNYALVIESSTIRDLDVNHSFNVFSLTKHTFADLVMIADSHFENITGHVLQMDQENDDLGIYNVEYVGITRSTFKNVDGSVMSVYRGGTDESTFGPHVLVADNVLASVGQGKRNKSNGAVWLYGAQSTRIHRNKLLDSAPIRVVETVGEPKTSVSDNSYEDTTDPVITPFERAK